MFNNKMKRGQITLFLIFVIILVIAIGFVFYTSDLNKKAPFDPSNTINSVSERNSIKFYTQQCLDKVLKDALKRVGENGGYIYRTPKLKIQFTEDYILTYLYIDREKFLPDINIIQSDIEKYINNNIRYCVQDFIFYKGRGWSTQIPDVKSNVLITEEDVVATVDFPVEFKRNGLSLNLGRAYARDPVPLKKIVQEVSNILEDVDNAQQKIDNGEIPDTPMKIFKRNGLLFLNYQYPDTGRFLWLIKDNEFKFFFATNLET